MIMNLSLPIVSCKVPANLETIERKGLYFSTIEELIEVINNTSDEKLKLLGSKMKEIALKRYSWREITNKYSKLLQQ